MAVGWAREGAVQEQIDTTIDDWVELERSRLPKVEAWLTVRNVSRRSH